MTPNPAEEDRRFMALALKRAEDSLSRGEFPVGAVLAARGRVVADGSRDGTALCPANEVDHAEMVALRRVEPLLASGEVAASDLVCYATLEPCLMCYAALLIHGVNRIVYAYEDAMGGGTACDLSVLPPLYRDKRPLIAPHVEREKSLALFQRFWADPATIYLRDTYLCRYTMSQSMVE